MTTIPRRRRCLVVASLLCVIGCRSSGRDAPPRARFVIRDDAVAQDTTTGLEWTRRDDGQGLEWHAADDYCRNLTAGGAGGWRLPDPDELYGLYGSGPGQPCADMKCAIDPVFTLTSPWVWTSTGPDPPTRTYVDFQAGTRLSPTITPRLHRRVLCVRSSIAGGAPDRAGAPPRP